MFQNHNYNSDDKEDDQDSGMPPAMNRNYDSDDEGFGHFPDLNGGDEQEEQIADYTAAQAAADQRCWETIRAKLTNQKRFLSMAPPAEMLDHLFHLPAGSGGCDAYRHTGKEGNVQYAHKPG